MGYDLERFKEAQRDEFDAAVAELRAGRKQTHWIWYIFPQLRGLGSSPYAVHYGLDGPGEASAYLSDPLLGKRYREALEVVHDQLSNRRVRIDRLMSSHIDALKLVSSLTLFEQVAERMRVAEKADAANEASEDNHSASPEWHQIASLASTCLAIAAAQGFPTCAFTLKKCREAR